MIVVLKKTPMLIGFAFGFLLLVALNIYSYSKNYAPTPGEEDFDGYQQFGFPFMVYESGTMMHLDRFVWCGIVANIFITLCVSTGIAWLFNKLVKTEK